MGVKSTPKNFVCSKCKKSEEERKEIKKALEESQRLCELLKVKREKELEQSNNNKKDLERLQENLNEAANDGKEMREALIQTEKLLQEKIGNEKRNRESQKQQEEEIERLQKTLQDQIIKEPKKQETKQLLSDKALKPETSEENMSLTENINRLVSALTATSSAGKSTLMELPEFDGSYKLWPRFKTAFDETTKKGKEVFV